MAEDVVDRAIELFNLTHRPCRTSTLPIHGNLPTARLHAHDRLTLYGTEADTIRAIQLADPRNREHIHPEHPYTVAEVLYAVRHEMAITVEDVLARRVRLLFLDARAAIASAEKVARIIASEAGHDDLWVHAQVQEFRALANGYLLANSEEQRSSHST
jgi:glycerol-3-phosphate dehydrogenase